MKMFTVDKKVFELLPDYCLGIVIAEGVDNHLELPQLTSMLDENVRAFSEAYAGQNVRELPHVRAYRDAFQSVGMNPNKYMCSIEALTKRVLKGAQLPHINPIVDLGNALSVKYQLSLGAHDIDRMDPEGLAIRFSEERDTFLPMGEEQTEPMPEGELVYVSGHTVKTRRWLWRQSEDGKITENTRSVFFPIDGFSSVDTEVVTAARDELADVLRNVFQCQVRTAFVDAQHSVIELK